MVTTSHTWERTTPTVLGRATLCCLIPIRFSSGAHVDHAVCRGGMECHDWLTTPACGDSGEQGPRCGVVSVIVYRISRTHVGKIKDDVAPGAVFLLASLSPSLSRVTHAFPLAYKRGSRASHRKKATRTQAIQLDSTPFNTSTRDLGSSSSLVHL
jgi:hypothetical protein